MCHSVIGYNDPEEATDVARSVDKLWRAPHVGCSTGRPHHQRPASPRLPRWRKRAVIRHVEISNYRSIGERTHLELGQMTALVGPNGSGKSNFADALRFIAESLRTGLEAAVTKRHGIAAIRRSERRQTI